MKQPEAAKAQLSEAYKKKGFRFLCWLDDPTNLAKHRAKRKLKNRIARKSRRYNLRRGK